MKKINKNIAIVGCGRNAGHHIEAVKKNKDFHLTAVCDLNAERAKNYSELFKVPFYTDYRDMLKNHPEISLVVLATPSGMHYEHSLEFISKFKKSIIVEKPTFMTPTQAKKIFHKADENKVKVYPVFQNRHNKAVKRVKEAIDDGELGDIRVTSVRVRWCRPQRYYDLSEWRGTFSHDGGALTNQGIHHVDLLRYLGGEIDEVNCSMATLGADIEVEDSVVANFKYKNGGIGSLEVTTAARPDDFEASISIIGSKGLAQIGGIAVNILDIFTPDPVECEKFSDDFSDLSDRGRIYGRGHRDIYNQINNDLNFSLEYSPSYNDSLNTLNLLHAFYVSNETKKWINLSEELESENLGKSNEKISNLYRI